MRQCRALPGSMRAQQIRYCGSQPSNTLETEILDYVKALLVFIGISMSSMEPEGSPGLVSPVKRKALPPAPPPRKALARLAF